MFGECKPTRNGANFLAFLRKAVKPHDGTEIHVVLDNLSTHTTPDVMAWLQMSVVAALLLGLTTGCTAQIECWPPARPASDSRTPAAGLAIGG